MFLNTNILMPCKHNNSIPGSLENLLETRDIYFQTLSRKFLNFIELYRLDCNFLLLMQLVKPAQSRRSPFAYFMWKLSYYKLRILEEKFSRLMFSIVFESYFLEHHQPVKDSIVGPIMLMASRSSTLSLCYTFNSKCCKDKYGGTFFNRNQLLCSKNSTALLN